MRSRAVREECVTVSERIKIIRETEREPELSKREGRRRSIECSTRVGAAVMM